MADLGLRDIGVRNDPRGLAARGGRALVLGFVLLVAAFAVACALLMQAGADRWLTASFLFACFLATTAVMARTMGRAPVQVIRVDADGRNQATWMAVLPLLLSSGLLFALNGLAAVALLAVSLVLGAVVWRRRQLVPDALRTLRAELGRDEQVLGDATAVVAGSRGTRAFRLVVATDRRLLVARLPEPGPFVDLDLPYAQVRRFTVAWRYGGMFGSLSLHVGDDTHELTSMLPANLVSVAAALVAHGVPASDPAALAAAERDWAEARQRNGRPPAKPDPGVLSSPAFNRGLWLLLAVAAVALYLNPFGIGLGGTRNELLALPVVFAGACASGYVAATRHAVAYLAPLILLLVPAFFFADASGVIAYMVLVSVLAFTGLRIGAALRREPPTPAGDPTPRRVDVLRLSRGILLGFAALFAGAAVLGFEPIMVRLAVDEAIGHQLAVDGRSDLTRGAATLSYTPGKGLHEFETNETWSADPGDGARWELRSSFTKGQNVVSLASYVFSPRLDDPDAVADFVAGKDREHADLAGHPVEHTEVRVDGRTGYVWEHGNRAGYWHRATWFPDPVYSVRLECIAKREADRFRRLCDEALDTLRFTR